MDVFAPVEKRNINFAVIFGNHDSDGPFIMSRDNMVDYLNRCSHSVTMGPAEFRRENGNYVRTVKVLALRENGLRLPSFS